MHKIIRRKGKKAQEIIFNPMVTYKVGGFEMTRQSIFSQFKTDLLKQKFNTYKTLAWYIRNPMMNYLKWMER